MRIIFLMMICSYANAAMYSCVDESGTKILKNYPCEQNEEQQVIANEVEPSHAIIHSTGERINFLSREPEIYIQTAASSIAIGDKRKTRQHSMSEQMQEILSDAKAMAAEHPGNGALIMASAFCGLWKSNSQAEQRQALLSEAKVSAAEHPGNGSLIVSAALGRCPDSASPPASSRSAINTQTGEFYPGVAGGVINPRNGAFYPEVAGGYINPQTGQFMPKQ